MLGDLAGLSARLSMPTADGPMRFDSDSSALRAPYAGRHRKKPPYLRAVHLARRPPQPREPERPTQSAAPEPKRDREELAKLGVSIRAMHPDHGPLPPLPGLPQCAAGPGVRDGFGPTGCDRKQHGIVTPLAGE